ncbi:NAD(+)/NADH kinase [soil metagenome]
MDGIDKLVLVTRATPLQESVARFGTRDQARFVMERARVRSFAPLQSYEEKFSSAREAILRAVPSEVKVQEVDREFLPNYVFGPHDLVATLGPDGLVVNVAKYLSGQPLMAFNPDPSQIDGVLAAFEAAEAARLFRLRSFRLRRLAMARVALADGQEMHAMNDLFIGQRTHVSARYRLSFANQAEDQSSSGIIVSTGAGSTGWYRSLVTGAAGLTDAELPDYRWDAEAEELRFTVREPFVSRASAAGIVHGKLTGGASLEIASTMAQGGTIFSDGIEEDFLPFDSGAVATVSVAERRVHLVAG